MLIGSNKPNSLDYSASTYTSRLMMDIVCCNKDFKLPLALIIQSDPWVSNRQWEQRAREKPGYSSYHSWCHGTFTYNVRDGCPDRTQFNQLESSSATSRIWSGVSPYLLSSKLECAFQHATTVHSHTLWDVWVDTVTGKCKSPHFASEKGSNGAKNGLIPSSRSSTPPRR